MYCFSSKCLRVLSHVTYDCSLLIIINVTHIVADRLKTLKHRQRHIQIYISGVGVWALLYWVPISIQRSTIPFTRPGTVARALAWSINIAGFLMLVSGARETWVEVPYAGLWSTILFSIPINTLGLLRGTSSRSTFS
jgi:hypothetical protein